MAENTATVVRISAKACTYGEFCEKFLLQNEPCVFGEDLTEYWPCRTEWILPTGELDLDKLSSLYGRCDVPVIDCGSLAGYEAARTHIEKFDAFLDYIRQPKMDRRSCKYLKDWHFCRAFPEENVYATPLFFSSDWLNDYCDEKFEAIDKDYRFVYFGPSGSWTPLHRDVLQSFSWSANVCGRKRWILFPPGEENRLFAQFGPNLTDVSELDLSNIQHFVVTQAQGEVIFVPSGWYHQVNNLDDCLSINHNWINAANIDKVRSFLLLSLGNIKKELTGGWNVFESTDEYDEQCQKILKADCGMNMEEFAEMVKLFEHKK